MHDPLHSAFALAAAVHRGEAEASAQAALRVELDLGQGSAREVLRLLHLFFGFPRIVQALNACAAVLPELGELDEATPAPDGDAGEQVFTELYGQDASKVLQHLAKLDPTLRGWILEHAYARVLGRKRLTIAQTERLAVLCLASTRCWKQWESHQAIARRHGVSLTTLLEDCQVAADWLGPQRLERASTELQEWSA